MSNKNESTTKEIFETLDKSAFSLEQWMENNKSKLLNILYVIIALSVVYYYYDKNYGQKDESEAIEEMSQAMIYFQNNNYKFALNGDGQYFGFTDIADKYSGSKAGELAKYYEAKSYFQLKDYDKALDVLESLSSESRNIEILGLNLQSEIYIEKADYSNALSKYEKSFLLAEDGSYIKSIQLYRAALTAMWLEDYTLALKYFSQYINDFPDGEYKADVLKYSEFSKGKLQ